MNLIDLSDTRERHLGRIIARQARECPGDVFLRIDERQYTYGESNDTVNRIASGLQALGVGPGDRVCFLMQNSEYVVFLVFAVNKLGGVWVPVNTDYKGAWLQDSITRARPKVLVADDYSAGRVAEIENSLADCTLLVIGSEACRALPGARKLEEFLALEPSEPDMSGFDYGDTCAVLWTSGTTGRSKGVMQSHNVWIRAAEYCNDMYTMRDDTVVYNVLPLYNSAAWVTAIFRALIAGVACAMDSRFSVSNFWERVRYYRATQTFTLGSMHMFLWNAPPQPEDRDNSLLEMQMVPMPEELVAPFCDRFGVRSVGIGYSQSEALTTLRRVDRPGRKWPANTVGRKVDDIDVRLVDDDGNEVPVGQPGELWVKPLAPYVVFNGYFDDPLATAAAFEGPWLKTGDLLRRDEAQNFYFVDRKKDAVRYKGRNISTFEVEHAARAYPLVQDCAAVGVRSEELASEDELMLFVVAKPGTALEPLELARFINANAPYFFVPRYIEVVDSLPYTPTNKVQKYKLRERGVQGSTWDAKKAGFQATR